MYWDKKEKITIVCMQKFDEYDYNENKFLRDETGEMIKWDKEIDAIKYLNDNFKIECIDPEYITANHPSFKIDGSNEGEIPDSLI